MAARAKARYDIIARDRTKAGIDSARRGFVGLGRTFSRLALTAAGVVGAIGAAGLAAFNAARESARLAESTQLLATRFGLTIETLQRFQTVARLSGVEVNQFSSLFQRLIRRSEEAQQGNQRVADAFADLGVSVAELRQLDPEQLFLRFADAVAETTDNSFALQKTIEILDVEGGKLFNTLRRGSVGITELGRRADAVGATLDAELVEEAAAAATEIELLAAAFDNAGERIKANFVAAVEAAAKAINDFRETQNQDAGTVPDAPGEQLLEQIRLVNEELEENERRRQKFIETAIPGTPGARETAAELAVERAELRAELQALTEEFKRVRSQVRIEAGGGTLEDITRAAGPPTVALDDSSLRTLAQLQEENDQRTAQSLADALGRNGIIARTSQ